MTMLQALKPDDLPTPREEAWKYTNLSKAVPKNLAQSPCEPQVVRIPGGQACGKPVDILFTGQDGSLQAPVLTIEIGQGAEATVIERHEGQGAYWKNMVTRIVIGRGAKLRHIRIQDDDAKAVNTNMVEITLERDSVYDGFAFNVGGAMTRHEIYAVLNGQNGECSLSGLNLLGCKQHGDTTIIVEHAAPNCRSNQFYRSILDDEARGVFQGKVHVHQVAQKTDGYQLSNALLLSPQAEMDTKPELEIYADDVRCSHGATTGQLDDEPLFYLRARGLSEAEARLLLVQAFADEVMEKISDQDLRSELQARASAWLRRALEA